ncbi:YgjP family zinc-dependent metalloprotease [Castellaniella caeni]
MPAALDPPPASLQTSPDAMTDTPDPPPPGYQPHRLQIGQRTFFYGLRRSRQRNTLSMTVRGLQILVQAPHWVSHTQIHDFMREKATWLVQKLALNQAVLRHQAQQPSPWQAGGRVAYRGVMIELRPEATRDACFTGTPEHPVAGDRLCLPLAQDAPADVIRLCTEAWLKSQASAMIEPRLAHYLALAGEWLHSWRLSDALSRWGSCSAQRRINLHWRLVQLPPALSDYVIAHEVAHLKQMNHSPAFWQEVQRLYPDYAQARARLRQLHPDTLIDPEG